MQGSYEESILYFQKESEKWIESKALMAKMIDNAQQGSSKELGQDIGGVMSKGILRALSLTLLPLAFCSCVTANKDYTKFYSADPHSILIVPAVNKSVNVDAPDIFLSTISFPLAERGYYVFPVNMTKSLLEVEGLTDADLVHSAPVQ